MAIGKGAPSISSDALENQNRKQCGVQVSVRRLVKAAQKFLVMATYQRTIPYRHGKANRLEHAVQRIPRCGGWAAGALAANCAEGAIVGSRNSSPSKSQK